MTKFIRTSLRFILPLAILITAVMIHISSPKMLELLRLNVFDAYQRIQPREYVDYPVVIVDIDEESLKRIGQWPWPRNYLAMMTDNLFAHGVAAVGFDVVFSEPDRASPSLLLPEWKGFLGDTVSDSLDIPDFDAMFANAIENGNVVTGFVLSDITAPSPQMKYGTVFKGERPHDSLYPYKGAVNSLPILTENAAGNGALNAIPGHDGLIRKIPLFMRIGEDLVPGLVSESLRIAQGASTYVITSNPIGVESVRIGEFDIPTDRNGNVWVYFTEYTPKRYISAWELFSEDFDSSVIEGHIVLVGTSAAGLKDIRATPLNPVTNGVEVHLQALEQILGDVYLLRPDWIEYAELVAMVLCGIMVWAMVAYTSPSIGAIGTLLILICTFSISWFAFIEHRMLVDPVSPSIAITLLYISESLRRYINTERERKQVRSAFSHYMSPAMVKKLADNPDALTLGGEMKEMTILFCDIRGFTTISEQFDAVGLTQFINQFLTPMTDIILSRKGTIDKYMGDCIMAFWNAPLDDPEHAMNGCLSALEMIHGLEQLNQQCEEMARDQGRPFIPVRIGIGLNTDTCCVGNMGSDQRFDYSVLGDGVNLASRLEGQSKFYGMTIVIGEATYQAITGIAVIELDLIMVKGKTEAVRIYGVLGDESMASQQAWSVLSRANATMLEHYRTQQWDHALEALIVIEKQCDVLALHIPDYIALYRKRIYQYKESPPSQEWDGVYVATSK